MKEKMPSITQKSKISFLVQRAKSVTVVDTISTTVIFYFSLVLGAYRMKWVFSDHFRLRTN
jgi:hypothetical protein